MSSAVSEVEIVTSDTAEDTILSHKCKVAPGELIGLNARAALQDGKEVFT